MEAMEEMRRSDHLVPVSATISGSWSPIYGMEKGEKLGYVLSFEGM
jgi:hypothetical protein